jgi:hypothetical protein
MSWQMSTFPPIVVVPCERAPTEATFPPSVAQITIGGAR